jgi:hypothetical protein
MTYDSSDPKQVKDAKRKAAHLDLRLKNGIAKICNDAETRYALAVFLEIAGPFRDTYVTESRDDARNSGWKAAGLWWLSNALLHDPAIIGKMQADTDTPLKITGTENDRSDTSGISTDDIDSRTSDE